MRLIDTDKLKFPNIAIFDMKLHGVTVPMVRLLDLKELMPTVDAVPLEPLCQWLAGYAAPPNYALDEVRDDSIDPESLVYTANDRAKAWEFHFRELLKSGLMDTEE